MTDGWGRQQELVQPRPLDPADRRVALITIGQTPRPDLLRSLGVSCRRDVRMFGALDNLDGSAVQDMEWHVGDLSLPLFVWYNGQPRTLNRHALAKHVVTTAAQAIDLGFSIVAVLCTESFPELHAGLGVLNIRTDKLLFHTVKGMFSDAVSPRIGVFVPVRGQVVPGETRWSLLGEAKALCLPPRSEPGTIRDGCKQLMQLYGSPPDVVVLDCMGYGARERTIVERELCAPVVLAQELMKSELHRHLRVPSALKGGRSVGDSNTV